MICKNLISCFKESDVNCPHKCNDVFTGENVSAKENSKKYCLVNVSKQKVVRFHVDGGLISDEQDKKCDYLFVIEKADKTVAIFVELKGSDCYSAIKQLYSTINIYGNMFSCSHARVVCRSCSNIVQSDANTIRLKKMVKKLNGSLVIKTTFLQERTDSLI